MKTIEKERIIPSRTVKDIVYIAEDGTEFDNYNRCSNYEYNYKIEKTFSSFKHKKINFNSIWPPYYSETALAFYLSNETEAKFLFDYYSNRRELTNTIEDEFYDGEGWYIVAPAPKRYNHEEDDFYIIFSVKLKHLLDNEFMSQFNK